MYGPDGEKPVVLITKWASAMRGQRSTVGQFGQVLSGKILQIVYSSAPKRQLVMVGLD
jgi:hypothetical protein